MPNADGALQLKALGVRLKALGAAGNMGAAPGLGRGGSLRAQLLGSIREAARPAVDAARASARDNLPKRGGLNEYIASEKIRVAVRATGPRVGVQITAVGGWGSNKGVVRHPVFFHPPKRKVWVEQPIASSGWFEGTLVRESPKVIGPVRLAMEAVAAEATLRL